MAGRIPNMARGRRNRFFEAEGVDDLVSMVLELTAEISVLRERQYVTERVLEAKGMAVSDDIENWCPSDNDEVVIAKERERLLSTVLRTLDVESKALGENTLEEAKSYPSNLQSQQAVHGDMAGHDGAVRTND